MTDEDVKAVGRKPARYRLRVAVALANMTFTAVAREAGISRGHLSGAAKGRQQLSLDAKLRVARVLRVPAAVIWPSVEGIALEALHGR